MAVTTDQIRELRERTGAGIMDAKRALEAAGGNLEKAEAALLAKGLAKAATKSDRSTAEGVVGSYIHAGGRIGAMVELNCETDFVARTPEFGELARNIAMQVAAMSPLYLDESDKPAGEARKAEEVCLLKQAYIKDSSKSIAELVMETRARIGENIQVRRFVRYSLGE
ncbi:MAG: elongation factor Ts [Chloroflexota bacterium]